jgi:hypothetical protein
MDKYENLKPQNKPLLEVDKINEAFNVAQPDID